MNIKGLGYIATRLQLTYEFGEERWNGFLEMIKSSHPFFNQLILAITNIPIKEYLAFLDAMLKEFYNGDEKIYWRFGRQNAKYTLSENGPFHAFFRRRREPTNFITNILHRVWAMNYDEGSVKYDIDRNITHAYVLDLPIYHIYFEYVVMGYAQKAIELIGLTIKETIKVRSSAKEIYYKFVLGL